MYIIILARTVFAKFRVKIIADLIKSAKCKDREDRLDNRYLECETDSVK